MKRKYAPYEHHYPIKTKRVFNVYGVDDPEKSLLAKRLFLVTTDYERAVYVIENNITDIAENGYYAYMILEPLVFDQLYPEGDPLEIYRWSPKTDLFYHVGIHHVSVIFDKGGLVTPKEWIVYDFPQYKDYEGDISDILQVGVDNIL